MREIRFRGQRLDDGKWVYGHYLQAASAFIAVDTELVDGHWELQKVDPATVGQYTGLKDKNGKEIYEGDIVKCIDSYEPMQFKGRVSFGIGSFFVEGCLGGHYRWMDYEAEVIGTIYDNPELVSP